MNRTQNKRKPKPKPGAAKLNVDLDKKLEVSAGDISDALIALAKERNPTALHLILRWAENAEFAEECAEVNGKTVSELIQQIAEDLARGKESTELPEPEPDTASMAPLVA